MKKDTEPSPLATMLVPRVRRQRAKHTLTTSEAPAAKPVKELKSFEREDKKDEAASDVYPVRYQNDMFSTPGLPSQPAQIKLSDKLSLSVGVYIMTSYTGAGKTVAAASLVALAIDKGLPAAYAPMFEPRVKEYKKVANTNAPAFSDPVSMTSDLQELLGRRTSAARPGLVVCDSATLPLKSFKTSTYQGQATFPGGMQPSDRAFLDRLSRLAEEKNVVIVITLNTSLIPYADALYGAVEGHIIVVAPDEITVSDRSGGSKRRAVTVILPRKIVDATTVNLGYGRFNKGQRTDERDVRGASFEIGKSRIVKTQTNSTKE